MYQYQINLGDDNSEKIDKSNNFLEDDQKSKLGVTTVLYHKENDVRSKLNQILDKYRAPPQMEIISENKNNEVESILSNIENMISRNNANKPNELENYFNKDEEINNNQNAASGGADITNNNNQSQYSKLNVSHIKKNSIHNNYDNNYNNMHNINNINHKNNDVSAAHGNNNNDEQMQFFEEGENFHSDVPLYNPYLHLIIEVDVMENLMFEVNKRNKFILKTDYTSSFYIPDNYEIFVYDPFINFNFNSNVNSMNIKNVNGNRLHFYKNLQIQQQNILHTQNAHSVNYENFNNNAFLEKLNTSNLDNNMKNIHNTSVQQGENSNLKLKSEVNFFINNEGEVEMEDKANVNVANFAVANPNKNSNSNNNSSSNSAPPALICFSSKKNDINPNQDHNHLNNRLNKYDLNFQKVSSKNFINIQKILYSIYI